MNRHEQAIEAAAEKLWNYGRITGAWNWLDISEGGRERYRAQAQATHEAYCRAYESGNTPTPVPRKEKP